MTRRLAILATAVLAGVVNAGPMGLSMSETLVELQKKATLKSVSPFLYETSKLPGGHPDFENYTLLITPEHGLCKIVAVSKPIDTSAYGTELLSAFNKYYESLVRKYGKADRYDYLKAKSIWSEPNDWMTSLLKKERTLVAFWPGEAAPLVDNVTSIKLEAYAANRETGIIAIGYEFANAKECTELVREKRDSAL